MPDYINISLLRKSVQLAAFLFLVYGSVIVGFYSVDKISNALPALSCAYDTKTADYCTLIPLQHRMDHDLGRAIVAGTSILTALMPALVILGTFLIMFVVLNKAFCGWICPLGFFQEILSLIGQKLGLQRIESLPEKLVQRVRPFKWLMLTVLVLGLPLLAGMGVTSNELGSPFCRICPSRILTSMATGDTTQVYVDTSSTAYFTLSLIANLLFGLLVAWGLFFRQPFCRICPMLALHAVFKKIGLVRLVKNAKPRCEKCGLCAKACPMDIKEIHTDMTNKDVLFSDCTLCGRCVEFCPDKDVLQMKYAFIPIISADPQYFKRRKNPRPSGKTKPYWEINSMDPVTLTLPAALIAGLAFGAGPCNVTCLPYLGPVFLQGEGVKRAWRIVLPFTLGRLCGYTSLGLLAGFAGQALTELLQSSIASWILGTAVILVGLNLLRKKSTHACHQHATNHDEQAISFVNTTNNNHRQPKAMMPGALFMMGTGMALNPCVPLTAILAASAASGSAVLGMGLGLTFGIGAVVVPALVFGLLVAHFGAELKQHLGAWAKHIEKISGVLLILLGLATVSGWVQP